MAEGNRAEFLTYAHEWATALHEHVFSLPADRFWGKPWNLVATIDNFAKANNFPTTGQAPRLEIVRDLLTAIDPKPKLILEFGTFIGGSALAWGATLQDLYEGNSDAVDARVYSVEVDAQLAKMARDLIELAGLEKVVLVLDEYGSEALRQLCAEDMVKARHVDLLFLDHWEENYLPDLKLCEELNLFHVGSLVVADNADYPGAKDFLNYLRKGGGAVSYENELIESTGHARPTKGVEVSRVVEA